MDDPWPSLSAQRAVAEAMFGAHGPVMVSEWFAGELSRTGDAAFARSFSDHIQLPGVEPGDYLHRLISTRWGRLLGGYPVLWPRHLSSVCRDRRAQL